MGSTTEPSRDELDVLSVGLEVECWLPDLSALVPHRLVRVREAGDLFAVVAEVLSDKVDLLAHRPSAAAPEETEEEQLRRRRQQPSSSDSESGGASSGARRRMRCKARVVSAEELDWGRSWTASADASIAPTPVPLSKCDASPFPVELVSKIMRYGEADVNTFCDVVAALRSPPLRARTNDSTGFHVHVGRRFAPDAHDAFFSFDELARIVAAYVRFEGVINLRLLPLLRRKSSYCRDLRDAIAKVARVAPPVIVVAGAAAADAGGDSLAREAAYADACNAFVADCVDRIRAVDCAAVRRPCVASRFALLAQLVGDDDGSFARVGNDATRTGASNKGLVATAILGDDDDDDYSSHGTRPILIPPGLVLKELRSMRGRSQENRSTLLWRYGDRGATATYADVWRALRANSDEDDDDDDNDTEGIPAVSLFECVFSAPHGIGDDDDEAFRRCLLRDALLPSGRGGAQGLLSGAASGVASPSKYYKLNLSRVALPARDATLEFRAFPGRSLDDALVTWGWTAFVGAFVAAAARGPYDDTRYARRAATERDLLDFVGWGRSARHTLATAWFRDASNAVPPPRRQVADVKARFAHLFDDWLAKTKLATALGGSPPGGPVAAEPDHAVDPASDAPWPPAEAWTAADRRALLDAAADESLLLDDDGCLDDDDDAGLRQTNRSASAPSASSGTAVATTLLGAAASRRLSLLGGRSPQLPFVGPHPNERDDMWAVEEDPAMVALVEACDAWRLVFHAASALRTVVPGDDAEVWGRFAASAAVAEAFVRRVADALERALVAYCRKLRAAEACSRSCGLVAAAELCCGPNIVRAQRVLRAVRAAVVETRGDAALPVAVRLRVANLQALADRLSVAHAANLLNLCERAAAQLLSSVETTKGRDETLSDDASSPRELAWAFRRAFRYLTTSLLAPRVGEAAPLWAELETTKGWDTDRVDRLNADAARLLKRLRPLLLLGAGDGGIVHDDGRPPPGRRWRAANGHAASTTTNGVPPSTDGPRPRKVGSRADFETLFVRQTARRRGAAPSSEETPHPQPLGEVIMDIDDADGEVIDLTDVPPLSTAG